MCLSIKVHRPDHVLAEGKYLRYEWVVVHNNIGFRCGYVKIKPGHPWHGVDYNHIDADVHGGLTFGEHDLPCVNGDGPDDGYWIGFDTAHAGDGVDPSLPGSGRMGALFHGTIRTTEYVIEECKKLIEQARAVRV